MLPFWQTVVGPLMVKTVFGKLKVNDFVSVQPFLLIVKVTVGLHPTGTVSTGLGIFGFDKLPQVVVHTVE